MTDLKDLLTAVADRAEPIDDLAERAVNGSIRRRRRTMIAVPLAAAALAAVAVLVPGQLSNRGLEPVAPTPTPSSSQPSTINARKIVVPDQAPVLPERYPKPVLLAYDGWRVVTADGKHWTVPGALGVEQKGAFAVSPDGRRLAYLVRHTGIVSVVVRNIATGAMEYPVDLPESVLAAATPAFSWSRDGRWLAVDYQRGGAQPPGRQARLIDTATMRTFPLTYGCCVAGLPDAAAKWVPMLPVDDRSGQAGRLLRLSLDGETAREVPLMIDGRHVAPRLYRGQAVVSPDGGAVAFIWQTDGKPELAVADIATGTTQRRLTLEDLSRTGPADLMLLGWLDRQTVLVSLYEPTARGADSLRLDVYAIEPATGRAWPAYQFAAAPGLISVAAGLPR